MILLKTNNLFKSYKNNIVLKNINFSLESNQIISIIGPSGCGKSTFFNVISFLECFDSGEIQYQGQKLVNSSNNLEPSLISSIRNDIGYIMQENALFDNFNIYQNLSLSLIQNNIPDIEEKIYNILDLVGLEKDILSKFPSELSGGMQKRVAIARTVLLEPKILLFDEPGSGLDPITRRKIDNLILDLKNNKNISSIIITHDIDQIRSISDKVCCFFNGEIIFFDSFSKIKFSDNIFIKDYFEISNSWKWNLNALF